MKSFLIFGFLVLVTLAQVYAVEECDSEIKKPIIIEIR